VLYCFDVKTGELKWTYGNGGAGNSTSAGLNVFYGVYPSYVQAIANGVVYFAADEHTIPNPLYKGCLARALNATTGEEIWTLSEYPSEWSTSGSQWATADGYTAFMNGLDNNIYSIGRGPSQLSVTAPNLGAAPGQSVIISGRVTDISTGTTQDEQSAKFPNGVPVSSDASMKDWMGYVYQQKPLPTNFTGVEVTVSVVDSNGNWRVIGTANTDATGSYGLQWIPDISGKYTVIATFAGTNGYFPSNAETYFAADEAAPTPTPAPTQTPNAADLYLLPGIIGIILAIIVVGAVTIIVLNKKP